MHELPPRDHQGTLRAVVEAPKGARVKTKWDPKLDTTFFTDKDARSLGFAGPGAARRLVHDAVDAYERKR
ncbi:MAG TPA: hypothetical protein VF994_05620 [Myxococcales bacterium]